VVDRSFRLCRLPQKEKRAMGSIYACGKIAAVRCRSSHRRNIFPKFRIMYTSFLSL